MISQQSTDIIFAALTCWREARGELNDTRTGMLCCVRNRVMAHWIDDWNYQDVCSHPWQFSAMTAGKIVKAHLDEKGRRIPDQISGDVNLIKWPRSDEGAWMDCLRLAEGVVMNMIPDTTGGATYYHDTSLAGPPSNWGPVVKTVQIGHLVFYRGI